MKSRQAITWLVLISVVAAGTLLWLWTRHRNAEGRVLARGIIAMQQNDVNQAVGLFQEARRRYPQSYPAAYWLAVAELRLGQTDEARRTAQEAAQLAPQKPEPWVVRAAAFRFDANRKHDALVRVPSETEFLAAEALCGEALAALERAEQIAGSRENADVLAERGLCRRTMADLYRWREETSRREADRLAGTDPARAAALRKEAEAAGQKAREAAEQGLASLLASLRSKPDNARAAEAAQDLAMDLGKHEVVVEAYEQLVAAKAVSERAAVQAAQSLVARAAAPVMADDWKASQRAVDILSTYIESHPKSYCIDARVLLARTLLLRDERKAAAAAVDRVLELEPNNAWGRLLRAQLLMADGKPEEAKQILQPLGTVMRDFVPYKLTMAVVQRQTGYPQVERQLYREVLDLDPGNADAHLALIGALLAEGQTGPAETQLAAALNAAPTDERIVRFAVEYWLDRGRGNQALEVLDRIARSPNLSIGARETVADLYVRVGRPDEAEAILRQLGSGEASGAGVRQKAVLAKLAIARGRISEGRRTFEELVAANPKWAPGQLELARALVQENRCEEATRAAREAVALDSRDIALQLGAAEVLAGCGILEEAQSLCEKVLLQAPNNQTALRLAARIDLMQQDYDSAGKRFEALNAMTGQKVQDWAIQAGLAYREGRYARCVEICGERTEPEAMWMTAAALSRMGRNEEAARKLASLIELQPEFGQAYDRLVQIWLAIDTPAGAMERLHTLKNARPLPLALSKGAILAAMGKIDDSIAIYNAILADGATASKPKAVVALRDALATCYRAKKDPANELKQFEALAAVPETRIEGEIRMYRFYLRQRRVEQAAEVLDRLSRGAGDGEAAIPLRLRLASAYVEVGQGDKALAELNQVIAVRSDLPQLVERKVRVCLAAGKVDDALSTVTDALHRWPDELNLLRALVDVQAARRDYPAALAALDRMALGGETARLESRYARAGLLVRMGLYADAIEILRSLTQTASAGTDRYALMIAQALIGLGQHDEGRAELAKIPASSPYHRPALHLLATDLRGAGKTDEAIKVLQALVESRPDETTVAYELADALTQAGRYDEAAQVVRDQIARFAPRTSEATNWKTLLATIAAKKRDWPGAIEAMQEVVNTFPQQRAFRWQLALYHLAAGHIEPAAELLADEPADSLLAAVVRSLVAGQAGSRPAAAAQPVAFEPIIADPRSSETTRLTYLLTTLANRSDPQGFLKALDGVNTALADLARAYLASPSAGNEKGRQACALLAQAMIARVYGLVPLADYFCEEADKLDAGSPLIAPVWLPVLAQLGKREQAARVGAAGRAALGKTRWALEASVWEAMAANDNEAVIRRIQEAEKAGSVSPAMMTAAGAALTRQGRLAEALQRFEGALAADPDDAETNNNVAYLLAEVKADDSAALDRAMALIEKSLSRKPDDPGILETRGWIRVKRGEAQAALSDFTRVIELLRNDPRVHYHLGVCYHKLGQNDMARLHLANAVRSGGADLPEARLASELLKTLPATTRPAASAPVAPAK